MYVRACAYCEKAAVYRDALPALLLLHARRACECVSVQRKADVRNPAEKVFLRKAERGLDVFRKCRITSSRHAGGSPTRRGSLRIAWRGPRWSDAADAEAAPPDSRRRLQRRDDDHRRARARAAPARRRVSRRDPRARRLVARSYVRGEPKRPTRRRAAVSAARAVQPGQPGVRREPENRLPLRQDRKSTRLNSSHANNSY